MEEILHPITVWIHLYFLVFQIRVIKLLGSASSLARDVDTFVQ